MADLYWYLEEADEELAKLLHKQWSDAIENHTITCICGRLRAIHIAFRCLYCGLYFCQPCAESHFGETRQQRRDSKKG